MVLRALVIQNSVETVASPELVRETRFSTGSVLAQVMERATGLSKELATQASNEAERTALGECLSLGGTGEGGIRADEAALIV